MAQRHLDRLNAQDCFDLLAQEEIGRIVYVDPEGPTAVPVNYVLDGQVILFRIERGSRQAALSGAIAFEVDHVDRQEHSGWSVLVRGTATELPTEEVAELLHRLRAGFPRPWAEGVHNTWMTLRPAEVTGRRLGSPADVG